LGYFDEEQKDHLIAIARQMSIALENREQFYSLQSSRNELERAITVKDEFLSVMSHELRTPLNVIMGYTALLRDGMFGELSREQDNALQTVTIQSRDQLSIINELLHATQIGCGESPVSRTAVNLTRFLDELRTAYDLPTKKNLLINWDYPMDLPSVDTDSGKLKEILQNLIGNALKFTEEGTVNITARYMPEAQTIVLKVADTGTGIPKELVPTIFEKFRQVDSSATRIFGGVGLGLYIAKKYTELLGGDIRVESEPGIGSVFTVVIPSQTQASTPKLNLAILEESR
jgi:signal transduction histidine kinase